VSHNEPGWKKVERRVAVFCGTTRNPTSGGNSKQSRSDSLHPRWFIETKHGGGCPKSWPKAIALFEQTEQLARKEGKEALVVLHSKRAQGVGNYDAYLRIYPTNGSGSFVACVPLWQAKEILERTMGGACPLPDPAQTKLDVSVNE
jgi:hypothetical protein